MYDDQLPVKKLLTRLLLALFALAFVAWFIHFLTYGRLVVTTDNSLNTITVSSLDYVKTSKGYSKQFKGSVALSVRSGEYVVSVNQGSGATSQHVKVNARHTTKVNIKLLRATGVEPVIFDTAHNMVADSSQLLYLGAGGGISQLNRQNQSGSLGEGYEFTSASWADTSYGVAKLSSGGLYLISNGSVSPLNAPVSNDTADLSYAVTANRQIYVADGQSVYKNAGGRFKEIYANRPAGAVLLSGPDKIGLLSTGYDSSKPKLITIDSSGHKLAEHTFKSFVNVWSSWSRHGKYILVSSGSVGEVLDSSLKRVAVLPQSDFNNPVWLGDNLLFYAVKDQLWVYDLSSQTAQLVANMPLASSISDLSVSDDGSYVYLSTLDANGGTVIRRVGLRRQPVPDYLYKLQSIMPVTSDNYLLALINFNGVVVVVQPNPDTDAGTDLQAAKSLLRSYGFDVSKLQFRLAPQAR